MGGAKAREIVKVPNEAGNENRIHRNRANADRHKTAGPKYELRLQGRDNAGTVDCFKIRPNIGRRDGMRNGD